MQYLAAAVPGLYTHEDYPLLPPQRCSRYSSVVFHRSRYDAHVLGSMPSLANQRLIPPPHAHGASLWPPQSRLCTSKQATNSLGRRTSRMVELGMSSLQGLEVVFLRWVPGSGVVEHRDGPPMVQNSHP